MAGVVRWEVCPAPGLTTYLPGCWPAAPCRGSERSGPPFAFQSPRHCPAQHSSSPQDCEGVIQAPWGACRALSTPLKGVCTWGPAALCTTWGRAGDVGRGCSRAATREFWRNGLYQWGQTEKGTDLPFIQEIIMEKLKFLNPFPAAEMPSSPGCILKS